MSVYQLKRIMIVAAAIGTIMAIFTVVHAQGNEDTDTADSIETVETVEISEVSESVASETEQLVIETEETLAETEQETEVTESEPECTETTSVYDYIDSLTAEEAEYYYRNFFEIRGISVEDLAAYDDETFNAVMAEWDYAGVRAGLDANDLV